MQAAPGQDIAVDSSWAVDLGFGMSDADGFCAGTTAADGFDDTRPHVDMSLSLPTWLQGEIAFVPFTLDATGSDPDAQVGLDVALAGGTGGRLTWPPSRPPPIHRIRPR